MTSPLIIESQIKNTLCTGVSKSGAGRGLWPPTFSVVNCYTFSQMVPLKAVLYLFILQDL